MTMLMHKYITAESCEHSASLPENVRLAFRIKGVGRGKNLFGMRYVPEKKKKNCELMRCSLNAPELHALSDVSQPISLHQGV